MESKGKLVGGCAMTAPLWKGAMTEDYRQWMKTMGFTAEQIKAEETRRAKEVSK